MLKQYQNPRLLIVSLLGISSGLPLALTSSTLQAWFTQAGISLITIGALSLVGIPYIWKFLWAPLIDRYVPPLWGRRRGWIAITQLGLCITLLIFANLNPTTQPTTMGVLALVIAFISASQDIAVDAYRTDILRPEERGIGVAGYIFTYRIAMLISGGFALVLADYVGWRITYELMALLIAFSAITTFFAPEVMGISAPKNFMAAVIEPFADLRQRDGILLILLFVIFYKLGDAFALSLMSNFLLRTLGFSLTEVGLAYKTIGFIAMIVGAFTAGALLSWMNMYRALLLFGLAQAFSNLMFMLLAHVGKNYALMVSSISLESFCSGMSTAALFAFLTSLCDRRYSATQFACLSALASVGRVLLGPVAAVVVEHVGWTSFYGWSFVLCFPGIILLSLLRGRMSLNAEAVA